VRLVGFRVLGFIGALGEINLKIGTLSRQTTLSLRTQAGVVVEVGAEDMAPDLAASERLPSQCLPVSPSRRYHSVTALDCPLRLARVATSSA
jgi:hypothetical protein